MRDRAADATSRSSMPIDLVGLGIDRGASANPDMRMAARAKKFALRPAVALGRRSDQPLAMPSSATDARRFVDAAFVERQRDAVRPRQRCDRI